MVLQVRTSNLLKEKLLVELREENAEEEEVSLWRSKVFGVDQYGMHNVVDLVSAVEGTRRNSGFLGNIAANLTSPSVLLARCLFLACFAVCGSYAQTLLPTLGKVVRLHPAFDQLVAPDARIEVLATGFRWGEGPVWVKDGGYLLFSDVPRNEVLRWSASEGLSSYLKPAGYTGVGTYSNEAGSNGLTLDARGQLVSCEHGDRRVSVLTSNGGKRTLADHYEGKRFNSPNDGVFRRNGDYYFTDPPYGLPKQALDPAREIAFAGVYRRAADGKVTLLTKEFTYPNGVAFSPDERTLYVTQSDPALAICKAFPVLPDGSLGNGRVFFDVTAQTKDRPGLPDGIKVDAQGNVFSTGPGGVLVFAPDGTPLGRIETGVATANCAWGDDGSTLYLTAGSYLCRIRTRTKGAGW